MAKWILGVHSSANNDLVERIIDWLPVRAEVEKSVIMLWGRVIKNGGRKETKKNAGRHNEKRS